MSGQQFTFPPPPPPPPASSQSYPAFNQARGGQHGYSGREHRGDRGSRGYGHGSRGGGPRGNDHYGQAQSNAGYGGYPGGGNRPPLPPDSGFSSQMNSQGRGGYSLPNYPPVQLPQYPANLGQEYGYTPSNYATSVPRPVQELYPTNVQHIPQQYGGRQQHGSYGYGSHVQLNQPISHPYQNPAAPPPRPSPSNGQPILMGPPIHWSSDQQQLSNQTQQFPPPIAPNGTSTYQHGPLSGGGSPYRYSQSSSNGITLSRHDSSNPFVGNRGRGQKRGHGDAFGRPRNQIQRPQAAPAVPSFGGPPLLPVKPPIPQERPAKRSKKKRKHNQLGLTPKTEEHESSEEEEDDVDEEARLAATVAGSVQGHQLLQFEYQGQTSTLQTSSEIAAWIEERRKKFPTKARAEARAAEIIERKRQREEAQRAANEARREAQVTRQAKAEERRKQQLEVKKIHKKRKDDSEDIAAKAKRKVEKLRKQLDKEEKRAAKAELKASKQRLDTDAKSPPERANHQIDETKKRKRSASDASESTMVGDTRNAEAGQPGLPLIANESTNLVPANVALNETPFADSVPLEPKDKVQEAMNVVPDPLTPMSQPPIPDDQIDLPPSNLDLNNAVPDRRLSGCSIDERATSPEVDDSKTFQDSTDSVSDSSSDISSADSDDLTSSSGSSSSDADSDDDAPDQASSKRNGPEKVVPSKRIQRTGICREFLKSGRCRRGENCHWRHELPERGSRGAGIKESIKPEGRKKRVGLYQRLVEQEKEKEDREILKAIISLGEKGLLEPEKTTDPGDQ